MRLHWLLPNVKGVPVLNYHRVWPGVRDRLTVDPEDLRAQWGFLRDEGYECLTMPRFLALARGEGDPPAKAFLLTFDDGYRNNQTYALPLLREFGWEATLFIIAATLEGSMDGQGEDPSWAKLEAAELKAMAGPNVRYGLHGYRHEDFSKTSLRDLEQGLRKSLAAFAEAGIPVERVLAYPYGARPRDPRAFSALKASIGDFGIQAAFRLGNKPQPLPAADLFEMKRIGICGTDTLSDFKIKLRKGKLKPF